jgi:hypothetical protein
MAARTWVRDAFTGRFAPKTRANTNKLATVTEKEDTKRLRVIAAAQEAVSVWKQDDEASTIDAHMILLDKALRELKS